LAALSVVSVWGCVAAAAATEWPGLGMVVGVLGIMAIFIILADNVSSGGAKRAKMMATVPEEDIIAAAEVVLDSGMGDAKVSASVTDPSGTGTASTGHPVLSKGKTSRSDLVKMVQKFDSRIKLTL